MSNNTGNRNTGDWNTGDWNTGYCNTGNCNTGNRNTGNRNTGDRNTGNRNTGDRNTGNCNTGSCNTGNRNTGDWNTGDWNTGDWNTGDRNTGYCNTGTPTVRMFNKDTGLKFGEIQFPNFFFFETTFWIEESKMSDKEKDAFPSYVTTGGYLKVIPMKQAWRESWDKASLDDKKKVMTLPNWDNEIFKEISGIDVEKELCSKRTVDDILAGLSEEDKQILKKAMK